MSKGVLKEKNGGGRIWRRKKRKNSSDNKSWDNFIFGTPLSPSIRSRKAELILTPVQKAAYCHIRSRPSFSPSQCVCYRLWLLEGWEEGGDHCYIRSYHNDDHHDHSWCNMQSITCVMCLNVEWVNCTPYNTFNILMIWGDSRERGGERERT